MRTALSYLMLTAVAVLSLFLGTACSTGASSDPAESTAATISSEAASSEETSSEATSSEGKAPEVTPAVGKMARATFAGGCFWCMEPPFDKLDGVLSITSGYTGGTEKDPTYEQVSYGRTSHAEAVEIVYDPSKISYEKLLYVFWRNIDPTVTDRQFCDAGSQYRTAIYYHDEEQKQLAESTRQAILDAGIVDRVLTEIEPANQFYRAEDYHQDFYKKKPSHYKRYRTGCGRDARLEEIWGDEAGG